MKKLKVNFSHITKQYHNVNLFLKKIKKDSVSAYAAQAAFYIIVSAFPFFMFLLTTIQFLPLDEQDLMEFVSGGIPGSLAPYVIGIIQEVYDTSTSTVISFSAVFALWSASRAFYALINGLNAVYGYEENRNYFVLRLFASIHTIFFTLMLLASLALFAFGNRIMLTITEYIPKFEDLALLIMSLRASASLCILILFFLFFYMLIPNHKSRILAELPGAIATSIGWIGFSYLYAYYIDNLAGFSHTYGSLTAIVLLMLWLYACMYMLLLGGEFNVCLKKYVSKSPKTQDNT